MTDGLNASRAWRADPAASQLWGSLGQTSNFFGQQSSAFSREAAQKLSSHSGHYLLEKEVLYGFKSDLGSVLLQTRRCLLLFALSQAVTAHDDLLQALWAHLDLNATEKYSVLIPTWSCQMQECELEPSCSSAQLTCQSTERCLLHALVRQE